MNINILSLPFAIYVDHQYIYHKIYNNIRSHVHSKSTRLFLRRKYLLKITKFSFIDCKSYSKCINKLPYIQKRFELRFIYHKLPSGKLKFGYQHDCPYCSSTYSTIHHDHFLTCPSNITQKYSRL